MHNRLRTVILTYLKPSDSLLPTWVSTTRPLFTQVTRFSPPSPTFPFYQSDACCSFNGHQKLYFSSKPNSVVELIVASNWSTELESLLKNSNPKWTHETIVYVMKRLDKDPEKAWAFFNWVVERIGFRPSSSMYSLMLRTLVRMDSRKLFWIALGKMKEQGVYLDEETYRTLLSTLKKEKLESDAVALTHCYNSLVKENAIDTVVQTVVGIILEAEASDEVEKELGDMGIVLSDSFVIRVLKELRNQPLKALVFFRWVGRCEGYEHNAITYNAIVRVLGRDDSITEFWWVVEEMKKAGLEMDIDTYIKISRQFQKFKLVEDAVKLYELMMDGPFKPSAQNCSMLLGCISRTDQPDLNLVDRVVKKYEEMVGPLSKVMYDGIHRSLTSNGKIEEAEKIMKVMRNAGFKPDNITYSQMIFGLCKANRFEEACKVIDEMEADSCFPDIKTWTILIQGHSAAKQIDKAFMCFAEMMKKGCDPDADLLQVLVDGFLSQKKIDGAYMLLVEMVNKVGLRPWGHTYRLLIDKLLEARKLEEALNLLRSMKNHNYSPFAETFVQHISKFGTVEDAAAFLKALSVKEYPSIAAYLHVFEAFFKEGRLSEAKDLLFKCPYHVRKHQKICQLFGSATSGDTIA